MRILIAIEVSIISAFFALKQLRPALIARHPSKHVEVFLYSFPNFVEGVVGVLTVSMLLAFAKRRWKSLSRWLKPRGSLLIAVTTSCAYVLSQEFNQHSIGGQNTYDPFDVLFWLAGLIAGMLLVLLVNLYGEAE